MSKKTIKGLDYPLKPSRKLEAALRPGNGTGNVAVMSPKEFLEHANRIPKTKEDRLLIDAFKGKIKKGEKFKALKLLGNNQADGRHRATAAEELGIKEVPVIDYRKSGLKKMKGIHAVSKNGSGVGRVENELRKERAYGGPVKLPLESDDPNEAFRRLISWSFAVAPLLGRAGKAGGGEVEGDVQFAPEETPVELPTFARQNPNESIRQALETAKSLPEKKFEDSGSMMVGRYGENVPQKTAHDFVQQQLRTGESQLPQYDPEAGKETALNALEIGRASCRERV